MEPMTWRRAIPFPVYSILLSTVVGMVLWLTGITGESAAIISALLLELVMVTHRIWSRIEREADPLHGLIRTAKMDEAMLTAASIARSGNRQARALLEEAVLTFCGRVKQLQSSGMDLSPMEFMDFAAQMFGSVRPGDRLVATSHLAGGTYWQKSYGQRYERLNRLARDRGLIIERIYVLRDRRHFEQVREVIDRQTEFSDIRVVLLDDHEADGSVTVPRRDFFVLNDEVSAEFVFTEPNMTIEHIHVSTQRDSVHELAREYARIRGHFSARHQTTTAPTAVVPLP